MTNRYKAIQVTYMRIHNPFGNVLIFTKA